MTELEKPSDTMLSGIARNSIERPRVDGPCQLRGVRIVEKAARSERTHADRAKSHAAVFQHVLLRRKGNSLDCDHGAYSSFAKSAKVMFM